MDRMAKTFLKIILWANVCFSSAIVGGIVSAMAAGFVPVSANYFIWLLAALSVSTAAVISIEHLDVLCKD